MRRSIIILLLTLCGPPASAVAAKRTARAPAETLTIVQTVDAVAEAYRTGNEAVLRQLARRDDADPWIVADLLCGRGELAAAAVYALADARPAVQRLPAYVAELVRAVPPPSSWGVLDRIQALRDRKEWKAIAKLDVPAAKAASPVVCVRVAYLQAWALLSLREYERAAQAYAQVARGARVLGWHVRVWDALGQIGLCAFRRADWDGALEAWGAQLDVAAELGSPAREARVLRHLGLALAQRGDVRGALDAHRRSVECWEAAGDDNGLARSLLTLGGLLEATGASGEALAVYRSALSLARRLGSRRIGSQALNNLGTLRSRQGALSEALDLLHAALQLKEALRDDQGVADTLGNIGAVHSSAGDLPAALDAYTHTLAMARSPERDALICKTEGNIGSTLALRGEYDQALTHLQRSLQMARALGDRRQLALVLLSIGAIRTQFGDLTEALEVLEEARRLHEAFEDAEGVAATVIQIANVHERLGRYAEALNGYEEAERLARRTGDLLSALAAAHNVAGVHKTVGDGDAALAAYRRLRDEASKHGFGRNEIGALKAMGGVHLARGEGDAASKHLLRARVLAQDVGDTPLEAGVLLGLGDAYRVLGRLDESKAALRRALGLAERMGNPALRAWAYIGLGNAHGTVEELDLAAESYRRALDVIAARTQPRVRAAALGGIARIHGAAGRWSESVTCVQDAIGVLERSAWELDEERGAGLRDTWLDLFDVGTTAAMKAAGAGSVDALAYVLESGRAGVLRESLRASDALRSVLIPAELRRADAMTREREVRALEALRDARRSHSLPDARVARKEVDEAQAARSSVFERIQRHAKARVPRDFAAVDDLATMQARLGAEEALVLYGLMSEETVALVLRRNEARAVELAPAEEIRAACSALLQEKGPFVDDAHVEPLRRLVVDPLCLEADVKRVIVSPMGVLGYVPFTLLLPDREVFYAPSGTTYGILSTQAARRGTGVLAVGDPDYTGGAGPAHEPLRRLDPLPGSAVEVEAVGDVKLLGPQATIHGVWEALGRRDHWRAVHIACHALVDPDDPLRSGLALSRGADDDGLLTCIDLFQRKVSADLVVLSACESGKGKVYRAEGIVGLVRAFMYAGAPRVLCSLWNVDDDATRALMVKFYELWNPETGRGLSPAAALRRAQAHVRSIPRWSHPRYWAAWVLWGLGE